MRQRPQADSKPRPQGGLIGCDQKSMSYMLFIFFILLLTLASVPFAHGAEDTRKNGVERLSSGRAPSCMVPPSWQP